MQSAVELMSLDWDGPDAALRALRSLDDDLVGALESRAIRLLDADYIRSIPEHHMGSSSMPHRQHLERYCDGAFMSTRDAVQSVRAGAREVAVISYGWASQEDPDPSGTVLTAVRNFLRSSGGRHVRGVFWDWPCLHQKDERGKRSEAETRAHREALGVMSHVYGSPFGTMVIRHRASGTDGRGWCRFEVVISLEVSEQAAPYRTLREALTDGSLPPKLVEVGEAGADRSAFVPVVARAAAHRNEVARRLHSNLDAIRSAPFTDAGDVDLVVEIYAAFLLRAAHAVHGVAKYGAAPPAIPPSSRKEIERLENIVGASTLPIRRSGPPASPAAPSARPAMPRSPSARPAVPRTPSARPAVPRSPALARGAVPESPHRPQQTPNARGFPPQTPTARPPPQSPRGGGLASTPARRPQFSPR